jgi:hypothetical protein
MATRRSGLSPLQCVRAVLEVARTAAPDIAEDGRDQESQPRQELRAAVEEEGTSPSQPITARTCTDTVPA